MNTTLAALSVAQLRQALALKEQIEALQIELAAILAAPAGPATSASVPESERELSAGPQQDTGAAAQTPRLAEQGAKRHAAHRPSVAFPKEVPLLGLCLGADLPRPIRAARRKTGADARTRKAL
jgi:hypothetical protein